MGHSLGEIIAATVAGVFTPADAALLVTARAKAVETLDEGAMLAVLLPEDRVRSLITAELSVAAVNTPSLCVVAGPVDDVVRLQRELERTEVACQRLAARHAFHSTQLNQLTDQLDAVIAGLDLRPPRIPVVSNISGTWLTAAEATDPRYWTRQLTETVRFDAGLRTLLAHHRTLVEVGPGRTLASFVSGTRIGTTVVTTLPPRHYHASATTTYEAALRQLSAETYDKSGQRVDGLAFQDRLGADIQTEPSAQPSGDLNRQQ